MKKPVPLVFAVVILLTLVLPAYSQTGSQELVRVTIVADPAECVGRVAVFSYTRSTPVSVQWDGRSWVSEPLPKGENILISYEQKAGECEQYVMVNEQTLDKHFSDRIVIQLTYNATISIKASRKPSVYVTVTPNPADCLTGLHSNKPVRKQDGGYMIGPSKPGETVTITPVIAEGCMFVEWSGVQTTSQRQLNLNPKTNMTLFLKATAREYDKPQQHGTSNMPAMLAALSDMLFKNMPLIVIPALTAAAASTAVKVLKARRQKARMEGEFQRRLVTARSVISRASISQIVRRGWLWLDVDPVKAIVEKHDVDRRITAYLMLAGVIPVSPEKRRRIDEETVAEYYAAASATLSGYIAPAILSTIGQKLVKLSVQLAATDMDEPEKVRKELRSRGVDPYLIPRELAGLDIIVYEARGISVYDLGMRLEDEVKTTPAVKHLKCHGCGNTVYEDFKYCVACGAKLPTPQPPKRKVEQREEKQTAVAETECSTCGRKIPRGRYCIECGTPLSVPEPAPAVAKPTETKVDKPAGMETCKPEPPPQTTATPSRPKHKPEAEPDATKPPAKPVEKAQQPVKTVHQSSVVVETREVWQPPSWIVRDAERLGVNERQLIEAV
ncbi:MAG: zinc ribbon domain-containing protein [Candidatus Caldarchaeum sp.]